MANLGDARSLRCKNGCPRRVRPPKGGLLLL